MTSKVAELQVGTCVKALRVLDPEVLKVREGETGKVYAESNHFGDNCGPLIKWDYGGYCNVYEGDVEVVDD